MTHVRLIVSCLLLLAASASAQTRPAGALTPRQQLAVPVIVTADIAEETRAVVAALSKVQEPFAAQAMTLRQATDELRRRLKVNLVVAWSDLQRAGALQDTPLAFTLQQVTGDQILRTLLDLAAPGKLAYIVRDGIIEIHTRAWLDRQLAPLITDLQPMSLKGFYPDTTPGQRMDTIASLCRTLAAPDAWSQPGAFCKLVGGDLAVVGSARAHRDVAVLLEEIRRPIRIPVTKLETAGLARRTGEPIDLPPRLRATPGWQQARAALDAPADLPAGSLDQIAQALAPQRLPNLVLDWRSLAQAGITSDQRLDAPLPPGISLQKALCNRLAQASHRSPSDFHLALSVEGVVTITTPGLSDPAPCIAAYDLRDLTRRWAYDHPRDKQTPRELVKGFMATLRDAGLIDAAAAPAASSPGLAAEYEGVLLVRALPETHRAIARRLALLAH